MAVMLSLIMMGRVCSWAEKKVVCWRPLSMKEKQDNSHFHLLTIWAESLGKDLRGCADVYYSG
jgi:hypothetical protein